MTQFVTGRVRQTRNGDPPPECPGLSAARGSGLPPACPSQEGWARAGGRTDGMPLGLGGWDRASLSSRGSGIDARAWARAWPTPPRPSRRTTRPPTSRSLALPAASRGRGPQDPTRRGSAERAWAGAAVDLGPACPPPRRPHHGLGISSATRRRRCGGRRSDWAGRSAPQAEELPVRGALLFG